MNDSGSRASQSPATPRNRAAWQEVLAQIGRKPGAYTPEQLADLARRAGMSEAEQFAAQARALGIGASSAVVPQHLLFVLGDLICALPAEAVQGVERIPEVTPVPNTAEWVLGVVQVWGTIVSVVDLPAFLGLPALPRSSHNRLIVVTSSGMNVGFLVEAVIEMHALGPNVAGRVDARAVPEMLRPYALGALNEEGRTLIVLDPARLLASEKLHQYARS